MIVKKKYIKYNIIYVYIALIIIQVAILMNFAGYHYFESAMFESDAASELLLAEEIAYEGNLVFADNWYYPTELYVLRNQLILVPLFKITGNYRTTYVFYEFIVIIILILVTCFFLRSFHRCKENIALGVLLLLIPYGSYRRYSPFSIFLGVGYYLFFIIFSFLFIGLYFRAKECGKRKIRWLITSVLAIISLVMGCCGIRYLLLLVMPLCIYEVFFSLAPMLRNICSIKLYFQQIVSWLIKESKILWVLTGYLLGGVIYARVLYVRYGGRTYTSIKISDYNVMLERIRQLFAGVLEFTGFTMDGGKLISVMGVFHILALIYMIYLIYLYVKQMKESSEKDTYLYFLLVQYILNIAVLIITDNKDMGATNRYEWLSMMGFLFMPTFWLEQKEKRTFNQKVIAILACLMILLANDVNLILSYSPNSNIVIQYNEKGLNSLHRNASPDERQGYLDFLRDNEYNCGYATFWNAQVSTVLSGGEIHVFNIINDEVYSPHNWQIQKEQPIGEFILLLNSEEAEREEQGFPIIGKEVFRDNKFVVYDIK